MNKTDDKQETPRVDALMREHRGQWGADALFTLARQLELALAEAKRLGNLAADNCDEALERAEEAVRQRDEALSATGEGWIPVSERTPEHTDTVLFISARSYKLGHYAAGEWWDNAEPEWPPARDVTHWMPLPAKPSYVNSKS